MTTPGMGGPGLRATTTTTTSTTMRSTPSVGGQHQQELDRAFRHVYHEVTLVGDIPLYRTLSVLTTFAFVRVRVRIRDCDWMRGGSKQDDE